jgi:hypothetical protein
MNSMNDQRFFDLAIKVIAHQANDAERAQLDALLAHDADVRAEFARLETDTRLAKEVLPLVGASTASTGEFPAYARGQLQTVVRQAFGRPETVAIEPTQRTRSERLNWLWLFGAAAAAAVLIFLVLPMFRSPNTPVIELAILDTAGGTRGAATNEAASLEQTWKGSSVENFSDPSELAAWEQKWPTDLRPAAKIVYDPAAAEVRVLGRSHGKDFKRTFPIEKDLATTLQQVNTFTRGQIKK